MLVREAKLKDGTLEQYQALDEAIRTGQFIRNKCLRLWMDAENCTRAKMQEKSEGRLMKLQRRLSKRHRPGQKHGTNYHKARQQLGKQHLKIQRQRKDWAIKQAQALVASSDVVAYEDLRVANLVKNHNLAKSISDAAWSQFTSFLDYYGKVFGKAVVAVNPAFTSQECHHCGHRVKKSLSTRTHQCPNCGIETCRDTNAALNILKRGLEGLGREWTNNSTQGHWGTGGKPQTTGETPASADDEKSDSVSGVTEPVTA